MTREQQCAYLAAERRRLAKFRRSLQIEFQIVRRADFPPDKLSGYRQRLFEYRSLLANHWIAVEWTLFPPCGIRSAEQSRHERSLRTAFRCSTAKHVD